MLYMAKILRISNEHMSYKVFSIDDHTKLCQINSSDFIMMTEKAPHRRAGSVLPYSRGLVSQICVINPGIGKHTSAPSVRGFF